MIAPLGTGVTQTDIEFVRTQSDGAQKVLGASLPQERSLWDGKLIKIKITLLQPCLASLCLQIQHEKCRHRYP